jgi:hypothetical protein
MARIKLYDEDLIITGQETVIGSDVDGSTQNYKISSIRDYIEDTANNISQDNIKVLIAVNAVGTTVEDAINNYSIEGEPVEILDKQILLVRALLEIVSDSEVTLETRYYDILGLGKGTYGLGGNTNVGEENLLEFRREGNITLPSTSGNTPVVHSIASTDLDDPEFRVNNEDEDYLIELGTDYYFKIYNPFGLGDITSVNSFKLYRFVGGVGTYGLGNDASITADFEEVNAFDGTNQITGRKYVLPNVINGSRITAPTPTVENIADAVRDAYQNTSINISDKELVTFEAKEYINGSVVVKKYHWRRGERSNIQNTCVVSDFEHYNTEELARLTTVPSDSEAPLTIRSIYGVDELDPITNLNSNSEAVVIDVTEPQYFLSTTEGSRNVVTALYLFIGDSGTYGDGQADVAEAGDFQLIEYTAEENKTIKKTSQLVNDGDGSNVFATVDQIVGVSGLEAIDEGDGIGFRLKGRNAANFGIIGEEAVDISVSQTASNDIGGRGKYTFTQGFENKNKEDSSIIFGYQNESSPERTNFSSAIAGNNLLVGYTNKTHNNSYASFVLGNTNRLGTSGAGSSGGSGESCVWYSIVGGRDNVQYSAKNSLMVGANLLSGSAGCAVVGISNVDLTVTPATGQVFTLDSDDNPRFIVGNGDYNSVTKVGTRSNAFVVMANGEITAPSTSIADINNAGVKAITTNEYVLSLLREEGIVGTRVTDSVNGTYNIDWNAGSVFIITMTADTTFSDINFPTGTDTKVITLELAGNFTPTFPSYWEARPSNDAFDGTVRNEITVNCKNGTSGSENVTFGLENLAT